MTKIAPILLCTFLVKISLGQSLTNDDRIFAVNLLEANTKKFLAAVENVSDEQWKFKTAPDKWSIADVAEHIATSEDFLLSLTQKILLSPADPEKAKVLVGQEQTILTKAADRSKKRQAPEMIKPSGKFSSKEELIRSFKAARANTINYIKTTNDSLKIHVAPHPAVGDLTAYQWLIWIAAHADRHVAQLEEVMASSNFPKP
jgi:uncharacterized damage-inducible protein DinB